MEGPKSGTQSDQSAQIRFKTRKPRRGEDASEFAEELSKLGYTAYAGDNRVGKSWTASQIDKLVLDCFLDNLGGDLGAKMNEFFPKTMNQAIEITRNFETRGLTPGYDDLGMTVSYVHRGRGGGAARGGARDLRWSGLFGLNLCGRYNVDLRACRCLPHTPNRPKKCATYPMCLTTPGTEAKCPQIVQLRGLPRLTTPWCFPTCAKPSQ